MAEVKLMKISKVIKAIVLGVILYVTYLILDTYFYSWMIWQFAWTLRFITIFGFAFVTYPLGILMISRDWI